MSRVRIPPCPDPAPRAVKATAIGYLQQGYETDEARLLSGCELELSVPRPINGDGFMIHITLRASRAVIDRLLVAGEQHDTPTPAMKRIKSALMLALPGDFCLGNLKARAAILDPIPQDPPAPVVPGPEAKVLVERPRNTFRRLGRSWSVVFDGGPEFHISDSLGAQYLNYLFHHLGEVISALDLESTIQPERKNVRPGTSIQPQSDPRAVKAYLAELSKLRAARDAAEEINDEAETGRLDRDIEAMESVLEGRACAADTGERARNNVRQAIRTVRDRLANGSKHEQAFGEHIRRFVSLGHQCSYTHPTGEAWL